MTSDEKRPRDGADKPRGAPDSNDPGGMRKKELDRLLAAERAEDPSPDASGGGRTVKLTAVDLPDQNQQTLKLPALDLPGGDHAPPARKRGEPPSPPPPPPQAPGSGTGARDRKRPGESAARPAEARTQESARPGELRPVTPPQRASESARPGELRPVTPPQRASESARPGELRPVVPPQRTGESARPGELRPVEPRPPVPPARASDSSRPGDNRRNQADSTRPGERSKTGRAAPPPAPGAESRAKRASPEPDAKPEGKPRPTDKLSPDDNPFYLKPPAGEAGPKAPSPKWTDVPVDAKGPTVEIPASDNPLTKPRREPDALSEAPTRGLSPEENPYNPAKRRAPASQDDPSRRPTHRLPQQDPSESASPLGGRPSPIPGAPPIADSTWELPFDEALKKGLAGNVPWTPGGFAQSTTMAVPQAGVPTAEISTLALPPEESARLLADGQPRRAREPSWVRFGVMSSGTGDTTRKTPHADLPRGTAVGPFKLEGIVARAPSFTRYLATDPDSEPVLIEVSSATKEIETVAFVREAQAAARLDDPHLVRVIDAGEDRGRLYIVYEGYRWRTLEHTLLRVRPRPERAARMIAEAARGLATAHGAGLAHTALTLQDVICDEAGRTRVLGLGRPRFPFGGPPKKAHRSSSKKGEDPETFSLLALRGLNTPPEQARPARSPADAMVDVYALGSLLYTLVALRPPYEAGSDAELIVAVRRSPPPFVRDETIACPPALEAIIARAMARRPERRYASSAALAEDLERLLAGQTIEALPVGAGARLAGRLGRRRGRVAAGAVLIAALVVIGSLGAGPSNRDQEAQVRLQKIAALLPTKPLEAMAELRAAIEIAPLDPGLLRAKPSVVAAVAKEEARRKLEARRARANALDEQAVAASDRAAQQRRELEQAEVDRNAHDPTGQGNRSEGPEWARLELRRRGLLADTAASEGEAYAARLLAAALDPGEERTRALMELERARLIATTRAGEPAAIAFHAAAAGPQVTLAPSKVEFTVTPSRAEVTLFRYIARGPRLVAVPFDPERPDDSPERALRLRRPPPPAPLAISLPPGSYLAKIRAPGYREALYPIYVPPEGQAWVVRVTLLTEENLEAGWVLVPGGPFYLGSAGWRDEPSFLMTASEILDPKTQAPRGGLTAREAETAAAGTAPNASLPSLLQLEKAYRGVDGRRFPWGNGFDPSLARRPGNGALASPEDVSPYGIQGLAGGLAEWVMKGVPALAGGSYRDRDAHAFEMRTRPVEAGDQPIEQAGIHAVRPGGR
jgi:hypothetical protein